MRGFSEVTHFAKDFYDAGYDVDFVSPNGGYVPLDPISLSPEMMGAEDWEYYTDHDYMNKFGQTLFQKRLILATIKPFTLQVDMVRFGI